MSTQILTDVKGISRYVLAEGTDNDALHLHVSEVGPGQRSHPPHEHAGKEIFYIQSGTAEVEVGSERHTLRDGEALQVDCRIPHGIRNAGDGNLKYAVIIAH